MEKNGLYSNAKWEKEMQKQVPESNLQLTHKTQLSSTSSKSHREFRWKNVVKVKQTNNFGGNAVTLLSNTCFLMVQLIDLFRVKSQETHRFYFKEI